MSGANASGRSSSGQSSSGHDDQTAAGRAFDGRLLARVFPFVRKQARALWLAVGLLPLVSAFEVVQPYLLKLAIDEHIAPGKLAGLDRLGVLYLAAAGGTVHGVVRAQLPGSGGAASAR